MTNDDDLDAEGSSPMDVAAQQQPPEPARGRGRPRRAPAAANGAGTATVEPPAQQGAPTVTVRVTPPPQPQAPKPEAPAYAEEPPEDLTMMELLAGSKGGVEVTRIGPGIGPGWKGSKYRGHDVQMGRAGTLANSPRLLDDAQSQWGGSRYKFLGSVNGKVVEFEKILPGAPKDLIHEDDDEDEDDDLPPSAYDPTNLFMMPGAMGQQGQAVDPGWLWSPTQSRYVFMGRGAPRTPAPPPPGQGPSGSFDPRLLMHPSKEAESELAELRRKVEIEPLKNEINALKDLIRQQHQNPPVAGKDPFEAIGRMMEAQAKQAEIDRKARADEERSRLERERIEAKDRQDRLDRERKEEREKYDREQKEARDREERIQKEARDREERRIAEETRRRDEDRKDAAAARAEEARRQDAMLKAMTEKSGIGKQITEMVAAMGALKSLTEKEPAEKGEYDDAKDLIRTGAEALAEHIIPAASDALAQWRASKQSVMPVAPPQPQRVVRAQVASQQAALPAPVTTAEPAAPQRPRSAHDEMPLPFRPTAAQPRPDIVVQPQAPQPQAAPQTAPVAGPTPEQEMENRIWVSVINMMSEMHKAGVPAAEAVGVFQGWCQENKIPFGAVSAKLAETDADTVLKELSPYAGNPLVPAAFQATIRAAVEMLSTEAGSAWFDDVADALEANNPAS